MLICPVCRKPLSKDEAAKRYFCEKNHSFDIAREGYVNLLSGSKSGDRTGDDKISARSRRDFLNRGYFSPLRDKLKEILSSKTGVLLDICCGEGYYTSALGGENLSVYGFDLSREAVKIAAKRGGAEYFVGNLKNIPLPDGSVDCATVIFAPFDDEEYHRVLKKGGELYSVVPGERHLWGLKEALYENPYPNDEKLPEARLLKPVSKEKIKDRITLRTKEDIDAVFRMTPYFFRTSEKDKEKLSSLSSLETETEFIIGKYIKE